MDGWMDHSTFYNTVSNVYGTGLQTEMAMALWIEAVPQQLIQSVLQYLINNILYTNKVHPTTGIVGWKFLLETLSQHNRSDVALQLVLQDTYPSIGYMIQGQGNLEPATTLWELWDSNVEGPSMNSRNHIMFGSVGSWFYKAILGIRPSPPGRGVALGFGHYTVGPDAGVVNMLNTTSAAGRVATPFGNIQVSWLVSFPVNCGSVPEQDQLKLDCVDSEIVQIKFASYGNATGTCDGGFNLGKCNSANSMSVVTKACLGQKSCSIFVNNGDFGGDPCVNVPKHLSVIAQCLFQDNTYTLNTVVPVGSTATVVIPILSSLGQTKGNLIIGESSRESSVIFWVSGKFKPSVVSGLVDANFNAAGDAVLVEVLSGRYSFWSSNQ
eukprot:TRINITY_DN876_c0_g1_i2.p1 TRINITY_DN876_c0_g1~~TRINITY_DN876_c0_g1_i2.p1  ORF type:complete len:381 (-),score=67.77 TRINITY_DN876_c0_g1_i2:262-1404(-)